MSAFDDYYKNELDAKKQQKLAKNEFIEQKIFENFNIEYPKNVKDPDSYKSKDPVTNILLSAEREDLEKRIFIQCIVLEKILTIKNIPFNSNINNNEESREKKEFWKHSFLDATLDKYIDDNMFELERKYFNLISKIELKNSKTNTL